MSAPLLLAGDAFARGRAQAMLCPDSVAPVRTMVAGRLAAVAGLLVRPAVARFLDGQWEFARLHDPAGLAELAGIAAGYGIPDRSLFAYLHAGQLDGLPEDGCSAFAYADPQYGPLLGKNRDLRGPALPLQRVFRHVDPAWGGRSVLCVGSLGAPGAYSSGINSDGLALVDTQVVTSDQGVGLLRYFAMTRLLVRCRDVAGAIADLRATPQAGGGTLLLADAGGAIAAVEIGHAGIAVETPAAGVPWVARTNHFLSPALADRLAARPGDPWVDASRSRLVRLRNWLGARATPPGPEDAAALLASHDDAAGAGLCRHGSGGGSATISASLYACASGTLMFAAGNPCMGAWARYACAGDTRQPDGVRHRPGRRTPFDR